MYSSHSPDNRANALRQLVRKSREGDPAAMRQMRAFLYTQLARLSTTYEQREIRRCGAAVENLVTYSMSRVGAASLNFTDRHHFYSVSSEVMRTLLVDQATTRQGHRGDNESSGLFLNLSETQMQGESGIDFLELNALFERFRPLYPEIAHVFSLHYFGGVSRPGIAQFINESVDSISKQIRFAKAWFLREKNKQSTKQ